MKFSIKLKRAVHRFFYGWTYHTNPVPSIAFLQLKATKNIKEWRIKYIKTGDVWKLMGKSYFLVNSRYPNPDILLKGEVGADVKFRIRYVVDDRKKTK